MAAYDYTSIVEDSRTSIATTRDNVTDVPDVTAHASMFTGSGMYLVSDCGAMLNKSHGWRISTIGQSCSMIDKFVVRPLTNGCTIGQCNKY